MDSILIDEARTPLIISGPTEDNSDLYRRIDLLIPQLVEGDYEKDEKARTVSFTEDGVHHMEALLVEAGMLPEGEGLYDLNACFAGAPCQPGATGAYVVCRRGGLHRQG